MRKRIQTLSTYRPIKKKKKEKKKKGKKKNDKTKY